MCDTSKPPYILLNDRLPAIYTSKLLGRIVADPLWPPDEYVPAASPATPAIDVADALIEVTDQDAQITLSANRSRSGAGRLGKIFGLTREGAESASAEVAGKRVITRNLGQQREVFERLVQGPARDEILRFLSRRGGERRGYMVVGMKSVVDATVELKRGSVRNVRAEWEAPVAEVVNAAAVGGSGVPVGMVVVPELVNPGGTVERKFEGEWLKRHTVEGECVFAVRYRVIKLRGARVWSRGEPEAEYGRVHRAEAGHGVFASEDGEEEDASGSEDESGAGGESEALLSDTALPERFITDSSLEE